MPDLVLSSVLTSIILSSSSLIFLFIYLFIYFWLHQVFVAVQGFSLVAVSGGYSALVHGLLIAMVSLVAEPRF